MTSDNDFNTNRAKYAEIDALLRQWHDENRETAARKRDAIVAAISGGAQRDTAMRLPAAPSPQRERRPSPPSIIRSFLMHRYTRIAASIAFLVAVAALLFPPLGEQRAHADGNIVMLPEGGRLDAFDAGGALIGPCPLKHTDVAVNVTGHFARVNVTQRYTNTYDRKIEAVYTFPLSHRAAVDRMTMTIGDRVVVGEVKERGQARQIYEAARAQGYVASLLEQERPNIFTQSVANIEPGAEVLIEISYVEVLQSIDGEYRFDFPMVVAPRYIPGYPTSGRVDLPGELKPRPGVILLGPATFETDESISPAQIAGVLRAAVPINQPPASWWGDVETLPVRHQFAATYADGSSEFGMILDRGIGQLNGRWFHFDTRLLDASAGGSGSAFSPDTDQVPDASRITPMPVRPEMRAGHTINVTVNIDTGGPGILTLNSPQHEIVSNEPANRRGQAMPRASISLKPGNNIPNRDFLLTWRTTSERIEEAFFTHTSPPETHRDFAGGFFTFILQPPDRVDDEMARPRELIFVLDSSGSMTSARAGGISSHAAAKDVINKAIATLRPNDRFNVISFNNTIGILWDEPRDSTPENRAAAQRFVDSRVGGGGTEMRSAVLKALEDRLPGAQGKRRGKPIWLSSAELADAPADGREVAVSVEMANIHVTETGGYKLIVRDDRALDLNLMAELPTVFQPEGVFVLLNGTWETQRGRRIFNVTSAELADSAVNHDPMRIVLFVTDGLVGNDDAIIQAIRENAKTTRVFTIGMSRSPNRHLLDEMAITGRGAADYALPDDELDPIVSRFAQRIATPVLTDIELIFSDGLEVRDVLTPNLPRATLGMLPDLFDVQPLVIHGRYTRGEDLKRGTLTVRGRTGAGLYERKIDVEFPANQPEHDVIATLWARSKVGELSRETAGRQVDPKPIVALGEAFQIMTAHTSFVAVEKSRITIGGKPMLVRVPIEFPKDMSWEGIFGCERPAIRRASDMVLDQVRHDGIGASLQRVRQLQEREKYDEAREIVDALLEIDPKLPPALLLRDMLSSTQIYTRYREVRREEDAARLLRDVSGDGHADVYWSEAPRTSALEVQEITQVRIVHGSDFSSAPQFDLSQALDGWSRAQPESQPAPPSGRISFAWQSGQRTDGPGRQVRNELGLHNADAMIPPQMGPRRPTPASVASPAPPPPPPPMTERSPLLGDIPIIRGSFMDAEREATGDREAPQRGIASGGRGGGGGGGGGAGLFGAPGEDPEHRRSTLQLMTYPDEWEQLSQRRTMDGESQDSPADRRLFERMAEATVPIDFANNTLEEIVEFLHQVTGINIYVDWRALEHIGVNAGDRTTLQLAELPIGDALPRILEQFGDANNRPHLAVQDGVLMISSASELNRSDAPAEEPMEHAASSHVLDEDRLFDIRDLIQELNHWHAWDSWGGWLHLRYEGGEWLIDNLAPEENVEGREEAERIRKDVEAFILTYTPIFDGLDREQVRAMVPLGFNDAPELDAKERVLAVHDVHDLLELEVRTLPPGPEGKRMRVKAHWEDIAQGLIDLLVESVDPTGWDMMGGSTSTLRYFDGWLFLQTTPAVHRDINRFFDSLREVSAPDQRIATVGRVWNLHKEDVAETRIYDVVDLIHNLLPRPEAIGLATWLDERDDLLQEIVDLIVERVDTGGWDFTGGATGSLREYAGLLIVANTPENLDAVHRTIRLMRLQAGLLEGEEREAALADARAEVEFQRRLDERLREMLLSEPGESVLVAVLLDDIEEPTVERVRRGGLAVEATVERGPFVVGRVNVSQLKTVTMLDGVRRIELVER